MVRQTVLMSLFLLVGNPGSSVAQEDGGEGEDPIQALPKPSMGEEQGSHIRAPVPGMRSATPIEIPFWPAIDPRKHPGLFKALPLPIPGDEITQGREGRYRFSENADGLVMGQTAFGHAYFYNREQYRQFLRRYP